MLLSVRIKNYKCFSKEVEIDFLGNRKTDRLLDNMYVKDENTRVSKSMVIYGANNVGKSMLINAIESIVLTMSEDKKRKPDYTCNIPLKNKGNDICEMGVSFTIDDKDYAFDFKYNNRKSETLPKGFIYEKFQLLNLGDNTKNKKDKLEEGKLIYEKDLYRAKVGEGLDKKLEEVLQNTDNNDLSIFNASSNYKDIRKIREIFKKFAESIIIYRSYDKSFMSQFMGLVTLYKQRESDREAISQVLTSVDADILDFKYRERDGETTSEEDILEQDENLVDIFSLISYHKDFMGPSISIDSRGTIQIALLAAHIVDSLKHNKTLIVDEIDNGLHFKVTKALINMFNNDTNYMGQMIVTTQDTNLLNVQTMFRKEQIWFINNDNGVRSIYSLNDFSAESGTRRESNVEEKYKNGHYGAMPDPSLIGVMLDIANERDNKLNS